MSTQNLLSELQLLGVSVKVERDNLRVSPKSALTPQLRQALIENKQQLLQLLSDEELEIRITNFDGRNESVIESDSLTLDTPLELRRPLTPLIEGSTPMPEQTPLVMLPRSEVATRILKEIAQSLSVSVNANEQEQQAVEWEFSLYVHHYAEEDIVFERKRGPVEISLRGASSLAELLADIES